MLKGGNTPGFRPGFSPADVSAAAVIDPQTAALRITTGGSIVLQAGTGATSNAQINNATDIILNIGAIGTDAPSVFDPRTGLLTTSYTTSSGQVIPLLGGLVIIGGPGAIPGVTPGTGIFDNKGFEMPAQPPSLPVEINFVNNGTYTKISDSGISNAFVESAMPRNLESLLRYLNYTALQSTRVGVGAIGGQRDDSNAPSCQ